MNQNEAKISVILLILYYVFYSEIKRQSERHVIIYRG